MKYEKFYKDIKEFPNQFAKGAEIADEIAFPKDYNRNSIDEIILCGMGGSSLQTDLLNNILAKYPSAKLAIKTVRNYDISLNVSPRTFFILDSYSGNTEETISCYEQVLKGGFKHLVIASGGKLADIAKSNDSPLFILPKGIQPRLSTGYVIAGMATILEKIGLIPQIKKDMLEAADNFAELVDENNCVAVAKRIKGKVPIIYAEEENFSIARIGKIKMNENVKTQSFWNYFPELNHNEMVGWTNLVMNPFFLIFDSVYTNERNRKRIKVFSEFMKSKSIDFEIVRFEAKTFIEELLAGYYFMDLVSFYLASELNIDPEPVLMVEDFKKKMNE